MAKEEEKDLDSDSDQWSFKTADDTHYGIEEKEDLKPVKVELVHVKFMIDGQVVEHSFEDKSIAAITDFLLLRHGDQFPESVHLRLNGQALDTTKNIDEYDYKNHAVEVLTKKPKSPTKIVPEILPEDAKIPE